MRDDDNYKVDDALISPTNKNVEVNQSNKRSLCTICNTNKNWQQANDVTLTRLHQAIVW